MRTIWIARHGHREDCVPDERGRNWHKTAKRPYDPALSERGVRQVQELAQRLLKEGPQIAHVFASPFLRTVQSAHLATEPMGLPIKIEHGICEWLNPEWFKTAPDCLPPSELAQRYPRVDLKYRTRVDPVYPEHDEAKHVWPRVKRTMDRLLDEFEGDLLLIGHGSSTTGMVEALAGPGTSFEAAMCALTSATQAQDGKWQLRDKACVRHLSEP
ncbi:MAG TPA: histidine phosphatase family protein [Tepidisphaeraceae bacterium]|jgi:broad specificity phosphatase PhoE